MLLVNILLNSFVCYVVGVKFILDIVEFEIWFIVWVIGVSVIIVYVLVYYFKIWVLIGKCYVIYINVYYFSKVIIFMLFGFILLKVFIFFLFKSVFLI